MHLEGFFMPRPTLALIVGLFLSVSTAFLPSFSASYHVKTSGSSSGTGTQSSPWSLTYALSHPSKVAPGDTIWIHAGTYPGYFSAKLTGTSSRPIIVRNYAGGRATLEDRTAVQIDSLISLDLSRGKVVDVHHSVPMNHSFNHGWIEWQATNYPSQS
jgi:hypothetical protein